MQKWGVWSLILFFWIVLSGFNNLEHHNPGNIRDNGQHWEGQVECSDPHFACFENSYYGVRAMVSLLVTYHERHDIQTVEGVIERWMPPNENPTQELKDSLNLSSGHPLADVELVNEDNLYKLVEWIILHENGEIPYTRESLREAVDHALRDHNDPSLYFTVGVY